MEEKKKRKTAEHKCKTGISEDEISLTYLTKKSKSYLEVLRYFPADGGCRLFGRTKPVIAIGIQYLSNPFRRPWSDSMPFWMFRAYSQTG